MEVKQLSPRAVKVLGLVAGMIVLGLLLRVTGFIGFILGAWICLIVYIWYEERRLN